jgi:glycosyltransferase 2 family protein
VNRTGNALTSCLSLLIVLGAVFFYYGAFQKNWTSIQSYTLTFEYIYIMLSFASMFTAYILVTYGWFLTLTALSGRRITFLKSVAMVNTSNLTKYIPGKVWSYAVQMYWLEQEGFPKSVVLYVNLITLYVSLVTSLIAALICLVFYADLVPVAFSLFLLGALIVFNFLFIRLNSTILKKLTASMNRIFKSDMGYYEIPAKLMCSLHAINFLAAFCLGIGAYLLSIGIGFDIERSKILLMISSMLIADVVGFMAVIVPNGLGVREGVMYLMLQSISFPTLAIILPIATRILSMLVDLILGTVGFVLLKRIKVAGK